MMTEFLWLHHLAQCLVRGFTRRHREVLFQSVPGLGVAVVQLPSTAFRQMFGLMFGLKTLAFQPKTLRRVPAGGPALHVLDVKNVCTWDQACFAFRSSRHLDESEGQRYLAVSSSTPATLLQSLKSTLTSHLEYITGRLRSEELIQLKFQSANGLLFVQSLLATSAECPGISITSEHRIDATIPFASSHNFTTSNYF